LAYPVDLALHDHVLKRRQWQREEQPDSAIKHREGITKGAGDFVWSALDCRRSAIPQCAVIGRPGQ